MPSVIFLCVANSARSQLAEGLARASAPPGWKVFSAGSKPSVVNPLAVQVMREVGVDISHHRSKGLEDIPVNEADAIVTLCAEEVCPYVPGPVKRLHWPLPDPAAATGSDTVRLAAFRAAREEITRRLDAFWKEAGR